ncbi:MAG: N-acetylneuraminate synthase family protein [Butyrivibrio sp.]|nr:N-acetylneuraminate synthase family protein [Butyrivibrio sp.]
MRYNSEIRIGKREVSISAPVYFIADIASNHDGKLEQAKDLIWKAKEAGADAVKFQHFLADKIVSDYGFSHMGGQMSHQAAWGKSVYEVYKECECNRTWTDELVKTANEANIDFLTTPYDVEAVKQMNAYIPAYKIGSGDITWTEFIELIAQQEKPVLLATGASSMEDVERAVDAILKYNMDIVLMQCNTNYTGSLENYHYINLNVLKNYAIKYPSMLLGLSDHTQGHATVLGAVALGARVIEKHFTLDNSLKGPDHAFSMNPNSWKEMVERTRELELAMGDGCKRIEGNEQETVIVQRRAVRAKHTLEAGTILADDMLEELRPAPRDAVFPHQKSEIIGRRLRQNKEQGDYLRFIDIE